MSVTVRGYVALAVDMDNSFTLSWPAGTVAGDLAILEADHAESGDRDSRPLASGWSYAGTRIWQKTLTAADISAGSVSVRATMASLTVYAAAQGVGRTSEGPGVRVDAGGAAFFRGWTRPYADDLTTDSSARLGSVVTYPTDKHLHAVWSKLSAGGGYVELDDVDRAYYRGYEIKPLGAPYAPTPLLPEAGGFVDHANDVTISWRHNGVTQADAQEAFGLRIRKVGAGTWSWVQSDGTLTTTPTAVTSSTENATIDQGELDEGDAYEWSVNTRELDEWSDYSETQQFTPVDIPTVDSVTATAAAEDLTPGVAWTRTINHGVAVAWQLIVTDDGAAGPSPAIYDSGVQAGTVLSATVPPQDWTDGADYLAWVRVQQTGGLWSAWVSDDFTIDWTPPTAPGSVTAADQSDGPLQVTVGTIPADMDGLEVQYSDDGGVTWTALRTVETPSSTEVVDFPLVPYGVECLYRARVWEVNLDGVPLYSAWTQSSGVTSTDMGTYLVSDDGLEYVTVRIVDDGSRRVEQGVSVYYGLGATTPTVDRTPSMGEAGVTTLLTETQSELDTLIDWLTDTDVWWLRWPPLLTSGVRVHHEPTRMALAAAVSTVRLDAPTHHRRVTFEWVEQD